jgi:hypothetical protein
MFGDDLLGGLGQRGQAKIHKIAPLKRGSSLDQGLCAIIHPKRKSHAL